jgi:deoxycytidylate deaminase
MNVQLTKKDKAYFNVAKEVSKLSDFPRVQIGACAVYKHKVISTGYNSQRTSPLQKKYNKYRFDVDTPHTCHAEISCLKPLIMRKDIDFKNVDLYIYREYKNGELSLARPCASCMKLITELGIRNIYYTNLGGFSHEEILI